MPRIKAKLIQIEAVELRCHRCNILLIYRGRSRERCLCNHCKTTNLFDVVKEGDKRQ